MMMLFFILFRIIMFNNKKTPSLLCGREKDIASLPLLPAFCAIRLILNVESMMCCIYEKKDGDRVYVTA